jgi:UDP-N-acetylmuramate: L-alanyl-gamma-D-glutamyl-meso-diaminopimelate ligase
LEPALQSGTSNRSPQGDLPAGSHIHLIAVCGVGMASLAGLLQARGYRVTGSDQNVYPPMSTYLQSIGLEVMAGFTAEHLSPAPDLVIIGNAVTRTNPEAEAVVKQELPYISFPEALGKFLIGSRQSLVIAGTHGKTTTTALAAWVLQCAGLDPGFFVGGVPLNFGSGWGAGSGNHVVLEGDEYDTAFFDKRPKFVHYRPHDVILTSVEFDHADIYRDLDHVKASFRDLVNLIPGAGRLVFCSDFPAAAEVAARAGCSVIAYGSSKESDWTVSDIRRVDGKTLFDPCYRGAAEGAVEIGLMGRHNVMNALAVYAMGRDLGLERKRLLEGFASFCGVKRRQENKGEQRGVRVIDDFAHHPTAVRETIHGVKDAFPDRRIWAIFEPRSNTSRRKIFEAEFAQALALADRVVLAPLNQPEKVPDQERMSVEKVAGDINRVSEDHQARVIERTDEIAAHIAQNARAGDIVLVMSNGAFDGLPDKILRALEM